MRNMRQGSGALQPAKSEYGARGIGEISIVGCIAALTMATYATGVQARELPVRLEKLMVELASALR